MLFTFLSLALLGVMLSGVGVFMFRMNRSTNDDPLFDTEPLVERYLAQGRLMEAMVLTKRAIEIAPHAARPRLKLIQIYRAQGKLNRAVEEALELCTLRPHDIDAARVLADLTARAAQLLVEPGAASSVGGSESPIALPALRPPL